jgi:single-stranded-DNA-specific exonuclease
MESINNKIWQAREFDESYISRICQSFGVSDMLSRILAHNIKDINQIPNFLSPKIKNILPDPFHLLDMQKAVERTILAIHNKDRICIFADYDVDGATSAALLKNVFRDLNTEVEIYVPDRILEGYGITPFAVQKLKESETNLIITVDCGTTSHEGLKCAKDLNIDVIVIDHHLGADMPKEAVAIVNPNRIDESSGHTYMAAVGVSFLFAVALIKTLKERGYFTEHAMPDLMKYLDLVALGTVCDVMNIVGLNRAFVSAGLKRMNQRQNIGINALLEVAALDEKITPYHLGFVLGPRINAGGRVGKSSLGSILLSTNCEISAKKIAAQLNEHNCERKLIEERILAEAFEIAKGVQDDACIFVAQEGWHEGVIGIVAARIKEKFNKPVAVIAINNDICKASCRSIKNMDFGSKLINAKAKGLIIAGGGHAMAAGFTATYDKLQALRDFLNEAFVQDLAKFPRSNVAKYHLELTTSAVTMELMDELSKLEPYGNGNYEPVFKFAKLFVLKANIVGSKHISLLLAPTRDAYGHKALRAIAFNAVGTGFQHALMHKYARPMCFIGNLKVNSWQNSSYIQLHVKDIIVYKELL